MSSDKTSEKSLVLQRGQIKASLTRFSNHVSSLAGKKVVDVNNLQRRIADAEPLLKEFNDIQSAIEQQTETIDDSQREEFENTYYESISKANDLILKHKPKALPETRNSDLPSQIRLPRIDLPKFDGNYERWFPFYDTFVAVIHSSSDLSEIEKFHYLKSSLTGEAKGLLQSLETSSANYTVAWQLLQSRYDNKRIIAKTHIRLLFDIPAIHKETAVGLRKIVDDTRKHLQALKSLKRPTDSWDDLVVYLVGTKLDQTTIKEWESTLSSTYPKLDDLLKFLDQKCQTLESMNKQQSSGLSTSVASQRSKVRSSANHVSAQVQCCSLCNANHNLSQCPVWLNMSVEKRFDEVKSRKLCINCLKPNHSVSNCKSPRCKVCNKSHHALLHIFEFSRDVALLNKAATENNFVNKNAEFPKTTDKSTMLSSNYAVDNVSNSSEVVLSTALIHVTDMEGNIHVCRALLDCGSQSNFIRKDLFNKLRLPSIKSNISVTGIGQLSSAVNIAARVRISSRYNGYTTILNCLVLDNITENLPLVSLNRSNIELPPGIKLADPDFSSSSPIEMLIGADTFWNLLCVGQIKSQHHPLLQKTHLGWLVAGRMPTINDRDKVDKKHVCNIATTSSVTDILEKFWILEERSYPKQNLTNQELQCQKHFKDNVVQDNSGRFIVKLPFKNDFTPKLENNRDQALKRFYSMERKLERQPSLRVQYNEFMKEYLSLGHMSLVSKVDECNSAFYLPHHFVLKDSSVTTKLRVVFDASAKSASGVSLNDVLLKGPVLQDDVFSILLRFRQHQLVITADITKMYRQILLYKDHRRYQRIFWRNTPHDEVFTYELNTVTYGTAPASFLAVGCLHELAIEAESTYPLGSRIIRSDFYMDDLLTGANTESEAAQIRDEVISILSRGGFELRKWSSNSDNLLEGIPNQTDTPFLRMDKEETAKTLGILWNSSQDVFQFSVSTFDTRRRISKRNILSDIARVFDPLGLINPIIVNAKILMQKLWQLKIDWDESVPLDIHTSWFQYRQQLPELNNLAIPRKIISSPSYVSLELHGFCDASERAYGACLYLRCVDINGCVATSLMASKSRVAPLKVVSLPRLELCGAVLLAQLSVKVVESLNIQFDRSYFWTDSRIALAWITSESKRWTTFVANRVGEIQKLTDIGDWRHVVSEENPSDILSRGATPRQLINSHLWWQGPSWLLKSSDEWPINHVDVSELDIPEQRRIVSNCAIAHSVQFIDRFSSFSRLLRSVAYCLRFIRNCKMPAAQRIFGFLTREEIAMAKQTLIKCVQEHEFAVEIKALKKGKSIPTESKLLSLNPFVDDDGIVRVGGRIRSSELAYSAKHQILIPAKHPFTRLLIRYFHCISLHSGVEGTLAAIRQEYWPIAGRSTVRGIVRECVTCFKVNPRLSQTLMGSLPKHRSSIAMPFVNCGIDYCGPFHLKTSNRRNAPIQKAYGAIFVCCATTAIHCELVTSLSTEAFIAALKRFIARRGKVQNMYSDNGTNFVGANNELKKIHQQHMKDCDKINTAFAQEGIKWHFIPPNSPHFGGLWEASVKSVKRHLKKIAGNANLNYEELYTLLVQIEAILNSRPITPISSDPSDFEYLTPGHFLIGRPLTAVVEENFSCTPFNRLSSWERIQQMRQHFWSRWQREYLSRFQQRTKWKNSKGPPVNVGQLVVIQDDNAPPLQWKMGRITSVHPGEDGVVRVATVKTQCGEVRRAITRLCVLPINDFSA